MDGFERVRAHTGAMALSFGTVLGGNHVSAILRDLAPFLASSDIAWPGLTRVTLAFGMGDADAADISLRLIAARTAGARGASREQYKSIADGTMRIAMADLAAGAGFDGPRLCRQIDWHLYNDYCLPRERVEMLRLHDNVHIEEGFFVH